MELVEREDNCPPAYSRQADLTPQPVPAGEAAPPLAVAPFPPFDTPHSLGIGTPALVPGLT